VSANFRYHAPRGNPSGEEVRDGSHADNRGRGNRGGIAPTTVSLRLRAGISFGPSRPLYCPLGLALGFPLSRGLRVALGCRRCDHELPRWGGHSPTWLASPIPAFSGSSHRLSWRSAPFPSHQARPSLRAPRPYLPIIPNDMVIPSPAVLAFSDRLGANFREFHLERLSGNSG
jgi:hypothetical protein